MGYYIGALNLFGGNFYKIALSNNATIFSHIRYGYACTYVQYEIKIYLRGVSRSLSLLLKYVTYFYQYAHIGKNMLHRVF